MNEPQKPRPSSITGAPLGEAPPPDANEVFGNPKSFPFLWKRAAKPAPVRQPDAHFPGQLTPKQPEGE